MFWKFGFQNASSIDALLDQDDVSLEAILNEDDILQECKAQNTRLTDYFQRQDVLQKLFGYVSGSIEAEGANSFRYPNVAAEILCSEIWSIVETCLNNVDKLLVPFWDSILDKHPDGLREQIMTATHFAKVNATFLMKKPLEMLAFIRAQPNVVERLLRHIETPPFVDLLLRIIQLDEYAPGSDVLDWLSDEKLIPRLVALLSPHESTSTHSIVSDLVKGIISMSAPSPGAGGSDGMQNVPASNLFARQLARRENIEKLVAFVLDDFSFEMELLNHASSSTTNGDTCDEGRSSTPESPSIPNIETAMSSATQSISVVIELIRKNNSDYFEPYLFHTLRTRLIQVQQQMHMQTQDGRVALEQAFSELVDRMGVVHLGPLLEIMCDRLERFQQLLHKPRSPSDQIPTTLGRLTPLTFERYKICELYAELLHCSNMSLLNRSAEYDHLYDSEGRLHGGLSALEDLARVIAVGSQNEEQRIIGSEEDEMEPAQELPVSVGSAELANIEYSDDDEDMSGDEGHGSSDDAMEDVDISGGPPGLSPLISTPPLSPSEDLKTEPPLVVPSSPNVFSLPSPTEIASRRASLTRRTSVEEISPVASLNRNKSLQSLTLNVAKEGMKYSPVGDRLKQHFLETRVLSTLLDLFFSFPWNNFLHSVVYDVLHQILTGRVDKGSNRDLVVALFRDAHLLNRILDAQKRNDAESSKKRSVRLGYMGHLTLMSEDVIGALEHFPPDLRSILSQYAPQPDWDEYVAGRYAETKNKDDRLLGGGKPVVAPGATRAGTKWAVDEADNVASTSSIRLVDNGKPELKGEFRRTSRLSRETSADFGVAPSSDDNIGSSPQPQYARYAAGPSHLDEGSDEDDDDEGGWLSRHRFELQSPPISARNAATRRPLSPRGFDDTFTPSGDSPNLFDDQFGFEDDNFGPFSDAAAITSSDGDAGYSFTRVGVDSDDSSFDGFGEFGDFQTADGEVTPTGGSWSFASDASFSSNGSMDDIELDDSERARRETSPEETRTSIR